MPPINLKGTRYISAVYAACIIYPIRTRKIKSRILDNVRFFLYLNVKNRIMWPFKKKKKKVKPAESIEKTNIPPEKTYAQLKEEYRALENINQDLEDECAKEGLSWNDMLVKTRDIKEQMASVDKRMRKIQEPSLSYGKKWKGKRYELEDFISMCVAKELVDYDGFGYYATETAKTDVMVYPSDITENMYRTDFPYVLWFNK